MRGIALLNRSAVPGLSVGNDSRGTGYTHSHIRVVIWETGYDRKIHVCEAIELPSFRHCQLGLVRSQELQC